MMAKSALLVAARYKSLGETYTLARFARGLVEGGWGVHFLAFEFPARFLQQEGLPVTLLADDRGQNQRTVERTIREKAPQLILTTDFFLLCFPDMADVWSNEWLLRAPCPLASFDHLMFHPHRRVLPLAFHRRLEALSLDKLKQRPRPGLVLPGPAAGARPRRELTTYCEIDPLPPEMAGLIRSCPVHDPRPEADPRIFRFSAAAAERSPGRSRSALRAELGLGSDERLVLVPVGSWALQLCRDFDIPYFDHFPRLLVHHLQGLPGGVRLLFLSSELGPRRESQGGVQVEFRSGLPFEQVTDLTRAADLVLCDNVTSSSLGRAVLYGVPAAALVSSVETCREGGELDFHAPFTLTGFAREALTEMESRAPGSVFPFSMFPMGLREEMEPLFRGNPYRSTFEWLELFDAEATPKALFRLLVDADRRGELRARQAEYRAAVEQLPGAPEIAEGILARAAVGAPP